MIPSVNFSALNGLRENYARFAQAGDRIANPDLDGSLQDIADFKKAEQGIRVNLAVLKVSNDLADEVIDILV